MPGAHVCYKAVLLDQTKFLWLPTTEKTWSLIETNVMNLGTLRDILLAIKMGLNPVPSDFLMVDAALQIWKQTELAPPDREVAKKLPIPLRVLTCSPSTLTSQPGKNVALNSSTN